MKEPKTPISKKGINPFESPFVRDASHIMKSTKSKEEEIKGRIKDVLTRFLMFLVYIIAIHLNQIR